MKMSAIVTTYNMEGIAKTCIDSLIHQTRPFDEIIIVDNASTDRTPEIIKEYQNYKNIYVTLLKDHVNKNKCRNIGWKLANSDIVAIIESDSFYDTNWCKYVMESFEKNNAECLVDRRAVYHPKSFISKTNDNFLYTRLVKNKDTYTPFTAWVFKKDILEKLEGFDGSSGIEDLDLGKRLLSVGYHITYQPDAVCYHDGDPKTIFREITRSWWFGKEMVKYYTKHPEDKHKEFYYVVGVIFAPILMFVYPHIVIAFAFLLITRLSLIFYSMGMKPLYILPETFLSIIRKLFYTTALILEDI